MRRIKLGIIGTGIIAEEAHLPALQRLSDRYEVTALCNRTRPKAQKLAGQLGLGEESIWQDWERMLAEAPVEAVLICLPIELNYQVSRAAAAAGKHVLCEKPAGRSVEEARASCEIAGRYGVTYMVAEDCHFEPQFATAARLVREGAVGKPAAVSWNLLHFMDLSNRYAQTPWRIRHVYPGGYVLDGGVHFVHVLQMIAGRVASVKAETLSIEPGLGQVDTAFALLKHESGVLSSLNMGWRTRNRSADTLRIFGTEGSLLVTGDKIIKIALDDRSEEIPLQKENGYYLELADFHRAVTESVPPGVTAESTAHDVEVILALLKSAEKDQTVRLA